MLRIQNHTPAPEKAPTQQVLLMHVWLNELSPMIWRRLLVRDDSSLADLHYTLQVAFGWDDLHLNRFYIHSRDFCVYHDGGIMADNAHNFRLAEFSFRRNEKFLYEYDLHVPWQHIIRVEKILPCDRKSYPICISGQGLAPPEDCGGHQGFRGLQENNLPVDILCRSAEILENFLRNNKRPSREEALHVKRWLKPRQIDRLTINHRLQLYASGNLAWTEEIYL